MVFNAVCSPINTLKNEVLSELTANPILQGWFIAGDEILICLQRFI